MAGQSFVASARTTKTLGVTAVFMQRVDDTTLLGNVLMHLLESARHDCGERQFSGAAADNFLNYFSS